MPPTLRSNSALMFVRKNMQHDHRTGGIVDEARTRYYLHLVRYGTTGQVSKTGPVSSRAYGSKTSVFAYPGQV